MSSYPSALDAFTNPGSSDNLSSPPHHTQHSDANDAIEAIETAIGVKYGARARATRGSGQTINNSAWTAVQFTTEDFDTDGFHDNVTNPDRITIPAGMGGVYLIVANDGRWALNVTGLRAAAITKNGVPGGGGTYLATVEVPTIAATDGPAINLSALVPLVAGDYVLLSVFQNSGGTLGVAQNGSASLTVIKLA